MRGQIFGSPAKLEMAIAKMAARQFGLIARAQAMQLGATPRMIEYRLASGRWSRIHPAVYALAEYPVSWNQRLLAACLIRNDVAASHRSAARLLGLAGFDRVTLIEVSVLRGRWLRAPGVITHESSHPLQTDVTKVGGIVVTKCARTLVDVAGAVPPGLLEEAVDDAVRRGLVSIPGLQRKLEELARFGRPGIGKMRSVLDLRGRVGNVPQSPLETRVWRMLRKHKLPDPVLQFEVKDRGELIARVDFAFPESRVAVEADGIQFHFNRSDLERDKTRRNRLTALGWLVLSVTDRDVKTRAAEVCHQIRNALRVSNAASA